MLQRCKNSRNESCVTASASEVGIASPVTLQVGHARTGKLMWPCGNCGPSAEPEGVVPLVSCVETSGCTDVETVSSSNCWEDCSADALPSKDRDGQTQAPKREAEPSCESVLALRCEHKLQERVAHVPASRSDNVCVRLSTQSSAHNTEENCNAHGPSQLASKENVAPVWSQSSK